LRKALKWVKRDRDQIIMVFGEIDCRIHFYYQYKKLRGKKPMERLIADTVSGFVALVKRLEQEGYVAAVQGTAAPGREQNKYGYREYAGLRIRAEIYREFNRRLKRECEKEKIDFIEIYEATVGGDGLVKKDYAQDEVHVKPEVIRRVIESEYK
jgi:hypothetical protein